MTFGVFVPFWYPAILPAGGIDIGTLALRTGEVAGIFGDGQADVAESNPAVNGNRTCHEGILLETQTTKMR